MKKLETTNVFSFPVIYENIKGKKNRRLILEDGSTVNDLLSKNINEFTFLDYFDNYYKDTYLEKFDTPYIICSGLGRLPQIETLSYNNDIQNYLNKQGLTIFLYETLFYDIGDKKDLQIWYSELSTEDKNEYKIRKHTLDGFENDPENLSKLYCLEFESIEKFIDRNNLTNVNVRTCDYNVNEYLKEKYNKFRIDTEDIFLVSCFKKTNSLSHTCYEHNFNKSIPNDIIEKKFWSGNNRYEGFRNIIAAFLYNKSSYLSFNLNLRIADNVRNHLWFDLETWKDKKIYPQIESGLCSIEKERQRFFDKVDDYYSLDLLNIPYEYFHKSFLNVITECKFAQPTGTFSEKTLNAIKFFRPFVLVAPPLTLEFLRTYGIKTFGDYWDESYDRITNHEERLYKILELLEFIDTNYSIEDLRDMYRHMKPILEDNYNIISKIPVWPNRLTF